MRVKTILFLIAVIFFGCVEENLECPKIWELDRNDISSNAIVANGSLVLVARNSTSPNSIILSQQEIEGNFEASIEVESFDWDSIVRPQFRFEVYSLDNPTSVGGVAINNDAFFTYIESTDNRDMRIIHSQSGQISIKRDLDTLFCTAVIGEIPLSFKDNWTDTKLGIRLVLGTTLSTSNSTQVSIPSFEFDADEITKLEPDNFECRTF